MAIKTRKELLDALNERLNGDTSDETLEFIGDITDTLTDFENRANGDGTDWKTKYEENDASWRKRYRDRFFSGEAPIDEPPIDNKPSKKPLKYEDLFK